MRRPALLFAMVTFSLGGFAIGVGCGSSRAPARRSPAMVRLTAYARAVNLHEGDVPGAHAASPEGEIQASKLTVRIGRCGGHLPSLQPGSVSSPRLEIPLRFEARSPSPAVVWSAIALAPSAAAARRDLLPDRKPGMRACVADAWDASTEASGPLVRKRVSTSALSVALAGTQAPFGMRIVNQTRFLEANPRPPEPGLGGRLSRIGGNRGFDLDVLGFASGRAEVALTVLHAPGSLPAGERQLLALLYRRMKAHKL
jgi:hypothetical protein